MVIEICSNVVVVEKDIIHCRYWDIYIYIHVIAREGYTRRSWLAELC